MKVFKWIQIALKWYFDLWIQFFLHATDTSNCRMLGPDEILRRDGLVWDPELRKFRRSK